MTWDTVTPYHRGFREFAEAYEAFGFEEIHAQALPFLPAKPGLMLDVGAGSGRDAAWFAAKGWEVVAVEPAAALRQEAALRHRSPLIRWVDDQLPALAQLHRLGLGFDLVWLSGVWQHMPPEERPRAMRKLATLLKPGGRMVVTLRHGPPPADRPMWPVSANEVERLGLDHGLALRLATEHRPSTLGAPGVTWQTVILDLPDDGGAALPLLRGVILRQEKSATYKLALLRCIARIADTSPNVAREAGDDVELPLGLIALTWIRMFKPLVEQGLPQLPGERMGFVKDAFRTLLPVSPQELRPGARFTGDMAQALHRALAEAAQVIARMPATHLTFADDRPVFPTEYGRPPRPGETIALDQDLLWRFGATRVPLPVWQALRRMAAWIEPMLVAEWVRLTQLYAERAGRRLAADTVLRALAWQEPERDTLFVRDLAARRIAAGERVDCVWTGQALRGGALQVDHCLPWSAWACNDLWNLLPASREANARKSGLIVAAGALAEARPRILAWWEAAYLGADAATRARFAEEARTTLPLPTDREPALEELFAALDFRRLRLRQETQLPEWRGVMP
ncbi:class I SAM-dependent methyltransferase [Paracraurococcus lichenis]|uniref:Class I SAM-dependent methyltransferase n=1 Tax=Paracraurococcus lichenis TaxID=3064888 RepID=A0ABT9E3R0_9PROT|nr:class I SAM-dependent methyltransferase [Paracraurococcus sp. LOR1-02]MDO9710774.1 class I SAM-dependent methyltransferase [Paracraurococcus sp. LOR1-02]